MKESAQPRHTALGLTDDDLMTMYRTMVTARLCDEAQFRLNRQGKAPFVVPVSGHEGAQVGDRLAHDPGKDIFVPYYRDMAVCLVAGMTPKDVFLGVFGKADDPSSGGRQMPAHWGSSRLGIITGSSPIATQVLHAAGVGYAAKYRGEDSVVGCWFGDGATSEGDWHEALNFAGIHKLPVVFVCENNRYAISVPLAKQMAVEGRRRPGRGLRVRGRRRRRQRRPGDLRGDGRGGRAGPGRRRPDLHRGQDVPLPSPHLGRRRPDLPRPRGGRGGPQERPDPGVRPST